MKRRTVWLGLILLASQMAAGCCHYRCGWWRMNRCASCTPAFGAALPPAGPAFAGPSFAGPGFGGPDASCPSCFYGPNASATAVMGAPMSFAPPTIVTAPPAGAPIVEPSRIGTPTPLPMPKTSGF